MPTAEELVETLASTPSSLDGDLLKELAQEIEEGKELKLQDIMPKVEKPPVEMNKPIPPPVKPKNKGTLRELDRYADLVLGLLGPTDADPFRDYCNSNAIGGAVSKGEVLFGLIRRALQDRDYSGALDAGWDSGLAFLIKEINCEVCGLKIERARLGQRAGCNAGGVVLEGRTLTGPLKERCPRSGEEGWEQKKL